MKIELHLSDDTVKVLRSYAEKQGCSIIEASGIIIEDFVLELQASASVEQLGRVVSAQQHLGPPEATGAGSVACFSEDLVRAINIATGLRVMDGNLTTLSLLWAMLTLPYSSAAKHIGDKGFDIGELNLEILEELQASEPAKKFATDLEPVVHLALQLERSNEDISTVDMLRAMMKEPQCSAYKFLAAKGLTSGGDPSSLS